MLVSKIFCILVASLSTSGILSVETEPGAQVVWEGVALGLADERGLMEIQDIPPGAYSLTVSKRGFSPLQKRIEVHAGRQSVSFRLAAPPPARSQSRLVKVNTAPAGLSVVEAASAPPLEAQPLSPAETDAESKVRRSSQIDQGPGSETPLIWVLLVAAVMAVVLTWFLRRPRHAFPPLGPERPVPSRPQAGGDAGNAPAGSSAAFLDDLRRREAMAEKGVVALARDDQESAIELDKTAVRHVEES